MPCAMVCRKFIKYVLRMEPENDGKCTHRPILMNDEFLDEDKVDTVKLCSQKHPITIIHGPPGTGKTTALAAVILSEVANGSRQG